MQFIDLMAQQDRIRDRLDDRIRAVLDHGKYIMGPEVSELENTLAEYVGVRHCIGVSSGTDALLIALMAIGIKPGDEVITTSFSFIATAETIALLNAVPVFVDIDPRTYNIDVQRIGPAISDKTKAIIPVSLYGQCADMDAINRLADQHGLHVIEDAAQSFGATYRKKKSCALSSIGCTSFFPSKPLGGYGDSGACFTNDDDLATAMREIRLHGQDRRYHHPRIGVNGRMDTMQAAILLAKFELFPEEVTLRNSIGQRYTRLLNDAGVDSTPHIETGNTSIYAQYTLQVDNREDFANALAQQDIPTAIHYPKGLHQQPAFHTGVNHPVCEKASRRVISLPMHPYLKDVEQDTIVETIQEFIALEDKRP
jgi:UDP-2-acetamido-2-deoxy-ribo-hexuluronate aminotransferase